ncbi:hypothetical protein HMPREF1987_01625 [Peptostreptococcaceae bacterium oral taxon 113 str. W5053]|nr:hypothetical protein HMPREF1987_01625 [Peptostreptococcaceae bacterium oral taxon 113 str. W5053]
MSYRELFISSVYLTVVAKIKCWNIGALFFATTVSLIQLKMQLREVYL